MKTIGNIFHFKKANKDKETIVAESLYQCPINAKETNGTMLQELPGLQHETGSRENN